ncbi:MAG: hypothetical protein ChlgKO_05430 [Chlamydiales bacterium]
MSTLKHSFASPILFLLGFFLFYPIYLVKNEPSAKEQKPFVILIPSYNNEAYCVENIRSALNQNYQNYRIIFINDCSSDRTLELVEKESASSPKVLIINNKERRLALANVYDAIHHNIQDDEIVVTLDGDDELAHPNVLTHLNNIYAKKEIWLTYGQYAEKRSCREGFATPFPKECLQNNSFRKYPKLPTHLRTFYAWLFKHIDLSDLQSNGQFYTMSWDSAAMLPMIEMARDHFVFIPEVLYIYNDSNPLSDHRINQKLQFAINQEIRNKPAYTPL